MKGFLKLATKHTVIFSIGDLAQKSVGFILLPVYMRCLSPADYGVLEMLTMISMLFSGVILQGIPTAAFRAYSYDYLKSVDEQRDAIQTAYTYLLLSSFLLYACLFLSASFWSDVFFKEGDFTFFIQIVFISEFFRCSNQVPFVMLRARLLSTWVAGISLARVVTSAFLTIWFVVFMDYGVLGVLLANMIISILFFVGSPLIPYIIFKKFRWSITIEKIKKMLSFGWPLVPGIFAAWIMNATDRYFLEHLSTRTELGLYSIGFKLASILSLGFIEPFRKTWPAIFFPKAQDGDAKEVFSRFATYFLLAGSIVSVFIMCVSDHLIMLMGPKEYRSAYAVVPVLVSGILIHGFQSTINLGLFIKNRTAYAPFLVICGALCNIAFVAMLVPRYGMIGAATGTMMAHIVMLALTYWINQRIYTVHYEYRRLSQLVIAYSLIWIANYFIKIDSFWWAMAYKTFLFSSFIILIFVSRFFTDRELEVMKETYRKYSSLIMK